MTDFTKFTIRPNWLFETSLNPTAREVYTVLLSHAWNGTDVVWPGIGRIAEMAGVGRTAAKEALRSLERMGLISTERRPPTVNRYTIRKLSDAELEQICGYSTPDAAISDALTRKSQNPTVVDRNPTIVDRNPTTRGPESDHEVDTPNEDVAEENETRRRNTPPPPAAAADRALDSVTETGLRPEPGGQAGSWESEQNFGAISSTNKQCDNIADSLASLRARVLGPANTGRHVRV